jgi:biopolymer transport protein ExbD
MALRANSPLVSSETDFKTMSEINVTPLVDVMLVLLTIFMITAPFLLQSVKVKLPETSPVAALKPAQAMVVSVQPDGKAFLGQKPIELPALEARLKSRTGQGAGTHRAVARRCRRALRPHHRSHGFGQPGGCGQADLHHRPRSRQGRRPPG